MSTPARMSALAQLGSAGSHCALPARPRRSTALFVVMLSLGEAVWSPRWWVGRGGPAQQAASQHWRRRQMARLPARSAPAPPES